MAESVQGSCFCGAVRFSVTLPSLFCAHCHCSMCRRIHGSGYVAWFAVPRAQLAIESEDHLRRFASSAHGERAFCSACGSPLFCLLQEHPDQVDIALASMHGPIDRAPSAHVFFDHRAEWVSVEDGLPRLGGASGLEPRKEVTGDGG